ncbi:Isoleucyl-tRNA synthetase, partial [hydrothermal vent metagenome]
EHIFVDSSSLKINHPLCNLGYDFDIPLFDGEHVTDEAGTGFVHTAPGHGREDFEIWSENAAALKERGIATRIPFTVNADGTMTEEAPGFTGKRVLKPNGRKGDANDAVIKALIDANMLLARGRMKHPYPHSWRSKAPVIFRNTPQWFISMEDDKGADGLRGKALSAIDATRFVPAMGQKRLRAMIESRPDWVISRQRAWGVPITVFVHESSGEVIPNADWAGSDELQSRIADAFEAEGADAWFADGARARFLDGLVDNLDDWEQVTDILDVWFDSGSTHAFVLEKRADLQTKRAFEGGNDKVLYLEGSDQHRGWFHSSLLESCGTRGRAPYDIVVTHGFTMAEDGRKMSKSLNNQVFPQDIIKQHGADILRLWVASTDYTEDQRIGDDIIKSNVDAYRKLRNTMRWMLGNLTHYTHDMAVAPADMPELERVMLHRLAELDAAVRAAYDDFDFRAVYTALFNFATIDLSAFYFDIRKDALYCDAPSSPRRRAALTVLDEVFARFTVWMAPILVFTMEECWTSRHGEGAKSVHLQTFPQTPDTWRNEALAAKWAKVRAVRRVVTGALEIERREKRIGSSLEAAPIVHIANPDLMTALEGLDLAEIAITSAATLTADPAPADAFTLEEVAGVAVVPAHAVGRKCARSWKVLEEVGADPDYPDVTRRDARALREIDTGAMAAGSAP